jgi:hypothetical protein
MQGILKDMSAQFIIKRNLSIVTIVTKHFFLRGDLMAIIWTFMEI